MSYVAAASQVKATRPLLSRAGKSARARRPMSADPADFALRRAAVAVAEGGDRAGDDVDLRQLRHHTKNTLQRIIGLLSEIPGLTDTPAGEQAARELEYRICLSAQISNALFGLTGAPGSMAERLRQLAGAMVEMMRDTDQTIQVGVSIRGCCPPELREAVIRSAHELIGNAVKHGMKGRPTGRITVRLSSNADVTTLSVIDNGWGFEGTPSLGEGLALARAFAEGAGGSLDLDGNDGTAATLTLKHAS
ncbi:MAG TPA: ATP-binding protein [Rhodopila sp.]|uniref:ATP-binding protein n=1 Tax=Rhodopila sp. TaxID=2480087 RepID=UPI002B98E083|nr:ATP-binding protein [Rhodopila sp.]HVY15772.1 ATP-binding protein [Rhodopila sp.]